MNERDLVVRHDDGIVLFFHLRRQDHVLHQLRTRALTQVLNRDVSIQSEEVGADLDPIDEVIRVARVGSCTKGPSGLRVHLLQGEPDSCKERQNVGSQPRELEV